ncbi:MAG: class I SAM-dependent methyltransferase [Myxococcales bacterium]|jgi:SAM-dependent methyltransferase
MTQSELMKRTLRLGTEALYRDARYYDHVYRRRRADVRFYVEMARRHGDPVLELGAGSGRVALQLARAGFDVVAVDRMEPMLARAREQAIALPQRARDRIEIRRGDLRDLRLRRTFPLVIAPFNVFMHLYERRDVERALATCRHHLRTRGRLVFDVMVPDLDALTESPGKIFRGRPVKHPDGHRYRYMESTHYDPVHQIRTINMFLEREDDPDVRHMIPLSHRQFFPAELEALLHCNGFRIEQRYGGFDRRPFDGQGESQIIVARRRSME